jgi:hypothetical protein
MILPLIALAFLTGLPSAGIVSAAERMVLGEFFTNTG